MAMMYTSVSQQWKGCFQQMKYVGTLAFQRVKRSCSLFTDYYTSWGSADRIYVC